MPSSTTPMCLDRLRARGGGDADARGRRPASVSMACSTAPCPSAVACRRRPPSRWPHCWRSTRCSGDHHEPVELALLGQRLGERIRGRAPAASSTSTPPCWERLATRCCSTAARSRASRSPSRPTWRWSSATRARLGSSPTAVYDERRAQCEAGAAYLRRYDPAIRALRDVSLELLESHESELPAVVARRCRFIVEEDQRVLDLAGALPAGDRARLGGVVRRLVRGRHGPLRDRRTLDGRHA